MSDIELAVRGAKRIESFLEGQLGAVGRGGTMPHYPWTSKAIGSGSKPQASSLSIARGTELGILIA